MNKRAVELSIQTIVVTVIALVVLIVIILILRGQLGKSTKEYFKIGEQATGELECRTGLIAVRECAASCGTLDTGYYWKSVGVMGCKDPKPVCCERGEKKATGSTK